MAFEKIPLDHGQSFRLLRWSDNVREVEMCLPAGRVQPLAGAGEQWHFHPEMELTLVTRGEGRRFVGDHLAAFDAIDLVLIGSNLPHYWTGLTGSSGCCIQFSIDPTQPMWQLHELAHAQRLHNQSQYGLQLHGPVVDHIADLMHTMMQAGPIERLAQFVSILSAIESADAAEVQQLSQTKFALDEHDHHVGAISQAVQSILRHLHEPIQMDDLLTLTHMSKSTFCRQFKRHTGRSFAAFVKEVRIDHARRLLADTDRPITQIAFDSGYRNLSHFNRQFREVCDMRPRDYRKAILETAP